MVILTLWPGAEKNGAMFDPFELFLCHTVAPVIVVNLNPTESVELSEHVPFFQYPAFLPSLFQPI